MKQLSVEERAIRYDEALNRCREFYETLGNAKLKKEVEEIFPELKESEDERIMGNIIATIHLYYGEPLEDEAKEMIAWLERRGQTFTKKDIDDAYLKGVCDAKHELEKQGEQKPAEFDDTNAKRMFIKALERVEEQNTKGYKLTDCDKNSWWEDFKAYTSCIVEQKPWSEEDEKMFEHIIAKATLHFSSINYLDEEEINFLKSLKDRYTWKPSDEQLDSLYDVLNPCDGFNREVLESLYVQLKKLKE